MRKLMNIFDYIFYRAYKLGVGRSKAPITYAAGIVSVSQAFALFSIFMASRLILGFTEAPNKLIGLLVILPLLFLNWYRYERNPRLDEMNEKWGGEKESNKMIKGWLIVLCIAFLIVTPLYIAKKDYDSKHPRVQRTHRIK